MHMHFEIFRDSIVATTSCGMLVISKCDQEKALDYRYKTRNILLRERERERGGEREEETEIHF